MKTFKNFCDSRIPNLKVLFPQKGLQLLLIIMTPLIFFPSIYPQGRKDLVLEVDNIVNPFVNTNNYSGTVLISKNDDILMTKSYGKMSREYDLENTSETKYFIASISMIFTSAAIMKLVEEGLLSLQDPISEYLPDYKHGNQITIHNLLSQRSGIPAIGTEGNVDYDSITKFEHDTEKLYSYFKQYELLSEPGKEYNHGRSDYILLAHIIEKITGKSFGEYLEEEIFSPLGMKNTGHYSSEKQIIENLAKGYAPNGLYGVESSYNIDWSSKTGHGSIYSTANDLNNFVQAAFNHHLLTKDSWNKIFTDYGNHVGYGWFITNHLNMDRYQMNGRSPGFSSYIAIYPDEKLAVIVLSNNYVSLPAQIGTSIAALALNKPFKGMNLTDQKLQGNFYNKLTGTYKFDKNFYRPNYNLKITKENDNLFSDWGGLIPINNGDKNFKEFILRTYWSSIEFIENEKGEITHMLYDQHKGIKIN